MLLPQSLILSGLVQCSLSLDYYIAERSFARILAAPEFLANPALYILGQIVRIILALAKGDLKHKKPLRSWLKPKSRKAQRSDLALVYEVDNLPAVNAVSGEAVRVPRQDSDWFF